VFFKAEQWSCLAAVVRISALWLSNAMPRLDVDFRKLFHNHQIALRVDNWPDRNERRENKRRPKILKLMTTPRHAPPTEPTSADFFLPPPRRPGESPRIVYCPHSDMAGFLVFLFGVPCW
jgi:hypothetical protein